MHRESTKPDRKGLLVGLFTIGLVLALIVLPSQFKSNAGGTQIQNKGLNARTVSHEEGLENYDIREQKNDEVAATMSKYRNQSGKTELAISDIRSNFLRGENELKGRVPSLKVEYNAWLQSPEVITPDVWQAKIERLSEPHSGKNSDKLKSFARENNELIGMRASQIDQLKVVADYTNPAGNMAFAHLEQSINGIPVFAGEIKAGFTVKGEIVRVINNLAPGLDYDSLSSNFGDPTDAVKSAFKYINTDSTNVDLTPNSARSNELKTVFGNEEMATTAEKMYFPTDVGVARAAWRVLIWKPVNAYYVIVDAEDGTMLWRKNITQDQTVPATYQVYNNPLSMINSADSPAPLKPAPIDPSLGTQGTLLTRQNVTLIGNEGPLSFNNNGWISDAGNATEGNATIAGLDIVAPNGVDAPVAGVSRVFSSAWNPPPGNPTPGDAPTVQAARDGAVIQMFYVMNRTHDALYQVGFTEAARNFQTDNFGRGGAGNDRISSEGQDSAGTNNANFSTPADGGAGRMQMFVFTGPTPDRDGTADADILIHEAVHGLSNRLHGNASGLTGTMAGGMGEGWSDWYAFCLLSSSTDPVNAVYAGGGHVLLQGFGSITTDNYYYGIRSFPKATLATVGGPNNRPHNPLTFADIDSLQVARDDGAFPPKAGAHISATSDQVHRAGEIWSSMLWEVRALLITRLGHVAGNQRALQIVTDGMKLAPIGPNFITERDAIIAAASALPAAPEAALDVLDVREGFRRRGAGFSARVVSATSPVRVVEAFDSPDLGSSNAVSVTSGNNLLEPNECNTLNVPLTNNSAIAATGITAVLSSTTPGITISQPNSAYPDIVGGGGPVSNTTPYQVSVDNSVACFTNANFTLTVTYTGAGGGAPMSFNFSLPIGTQGLNYAFTSGTATIPAGGTFIPGSDDDDFAVTVPLPSGWTSSVYGVPVTSLGASTNGMITVNGPASTSTANTTLPAAVGGTNPTLLPYWDDWDMDPTDTVGGGIFVNTIGTAPNRQLYVEWRATHFDEAPTAINTNFAVLFTEGSEVVRYIYALTGQGTQLNGSSGSVGIQRQATGTQFTQFSFNTPSLTPGLQLTAARPAGVCSPGTGTCAVAVSNPRSDFDGDGKTDLSVFRPSEGNWYLNRSTAGFSAVQWGAAADVMMPGDFDGDGKADPAVFRASNTPGATDCYILRSSTSTFQGAEWGSVGDVPVIADYDGDGKDDPAVYRPSTNDYFVIQSSNGASRHFRWGIAGDVPVPGDFDGDGKAEFAVFRPSNGTWYYNNSTGGAFVSVQWGAAGDIPVFANYDGDAKDDIAVYRPSTGFWYLNRSTAGSQAIQWGGVSGDVPVPGDYDGDGKYDTAVYRAGTWFLNRTTSGAGATAFGAATDRPTPRFYFQ